MTFAGVAVGGASWGDLPTPSRETLDGRAVPPYERGMMLDARLAKVAAGDDSPRILAEIQAELSGGD